MYDYISNKEYERRTKAIDAFFKQCNIPHIVYSIQEKEHRYSFIKSSAELEGNTFTLSETKSLLLDDKVSENRTAREHKEIINLNNAYEQMLRYATISEKNINLATICDLHNYTCIGIEERAGHLRNIQNYVGNGSFIIHTPINHVHIKKAMEKIIDEYNNNMIDDTIKKISKFHLQFEHIHPFSDGNGRVGRLLINLQLLQQGYLQINIPNSKRSLYMKSFKDFNRTKKIDVMLDIISKEEIKSIEKIKDTK